MAARIGVKILNGYDVPATSTIAYTVPTNLNRAIISSFFVVNRDTSARTLTIWVVTSAQTQANEHKCYINKEIGVENTVSLEEMIDFPLNVGDKVYVQASSANTLALNMGLTTFPAE